MKIAFFFAKDYERDSFEKANRLAGHVITYLEPALTPETARLAEGHDAVCIFVNDICSQDVMARLASLGVRLILCRSAGYNHVDLAAARKHKIAVMRVPAYSPESVAEHTLALILSLLRHIHQQHNRVRNGNYSLDGIVGHTIHGKTVGIVGTGKIGQVMTQILSGFGCRLLGSDPLQNPQCLALGMEYVARDKLFAAADIVILMAPLMPETRHMINADTLKLFRRGSILVNTSRGGLIDTPAVIDALMKMETIWYLGIDVYEEEAGKFFEDMSLKTVQDKDLLLLTSLHNALVTPHSAFLTYESLEQIASITLANATGFESGKLDETRVVGI